MKNKDTLERLINFWNAALTMSEEDKKEIKAAADDNNYVEFAPADKLVKALDNLLNAEKILDYGCGSAWASLILAKKGAKYVKGVDTSTSGIEAGKFLLETYNVKEKVDLEVIDEAWLERQNHDSFDGGFCSNVLDVLPIEISQKIIENLHKVLKKDAVLVAGLNFYADPKIKPLEENKYIYLDGVLRLLSLSDDEWRRMFAPYFEIISLDYFAWPGETSERRRLFVMKNK